jgi:uncharacterized membrane protein
LNVREVSLTAVVAALYAALVIVLAPISYPPIQLRVADCLIPLAALLGWPVVFGVSLGALVGNAYYFLGPLDVVLGPLANLLAAVLILRLRARLLPACLAGSLVIGFVVGGYLWVFIPPPDVGIVLPIWAVSIMSLTLSSIITVAVMGYALVSALRSSGFSRLLESRGVRTYLK